jgi:tRNA(Ile)-lysidine synthase
VTVFKDKRFCSDVFQFIKRHHLILPQKRYLLAVSGGLDSMVLLHFFRRFARKRYGCDFAVTHLDHGLRSESSAQAEALANYCRSAGIPFFCERRVPLASPAQSSLEAQARAIRYAWFAQLVYANAFEAVLTAHHATDQLETTLMQWVRGTSVPQGMHPFKHLSVDGVSLRVIRPFLSVSRGDLECYHKHYALPCWEDASNQDLDFTRNRLRAQVLPLLKQENPNLESTITEHTVVIQQEQDYLRSCMLHDYAECVSPFQKETTEQELTLALNLVPFALLHVAIRRLIFKEILTDLNAGVWKVFNHRHIEALQQLTFAQSGKTLALPLDIVVVKQRRQLLFSRCNKLF